MPLLGQASGGWTESSSALRLLNTGIRNSIGLASNDAFTQVNPVGSSSNVSSKVNTTVLGVLSGSVAFSRPDQGVNYVGGPGTAAIKTALNGNGANAQGYNPLGFFINSAVGNPFENTPGIASGVLPYMCAFGTYGDSLYETKVLSSGASITYVSGTPLVASLNGFLMPKYNAGSSIDTSSNTAEQAVKAVASTILGILKMIPDAVQNELVFDARV